MQTTKTLLTNDKKKIELKIIKENVKSPPPKKIKGDVNNNKTTKQTNKTIERKRKKTGNQVKHINPLKENVNLFPPPCKKNQGETSRK